MKFRAMLYYIDSRPLSCLLWHHEEYDLKPRAFTHYEKNLGDLIEGGLKSSTWKSGEMQQLEFD